MFLPTDLHSPVGALSDDVVLRELTASERTRGIVLEQRVLTKVAVVHVFVPKDADTGCSGHDCGIGTQIIHRDSPFM